MPLKEECLQIAFALVLACVNINKRQKATVRIIKYRLNKVVIRIDWTKSLKPLQCIGVSALEFLVETCDQTAKCEKLWSSC